MAQHCTKCNVDVVDTHTNCPLCGAYVKNDEIIVIRSDKSTCKEVVDYSYPKVNMESIIKNLLFKIAVFISVVAVGAVLIIDFLSSRNLDWSLHALVGIALFWVTIGRALFFKVNMGRQIVWDCIFGVLLIIYIQSLSKSIGSSWGFDYAIPAIIMACTGGLAAVMIMKTRNWSAYCLPSTILCVFCLFPIIYGLIVHHGRAHFMTYICAGVGIIILAIMMIFGKEQYFRELKKRFHL